MACHAECCANVVASLRRLRAAFDARAHAVRGLERRRRKRAPGRASEGRCFCVSNGRQFRLDGPQTTAKRERFPHSGAQFRTSMPQAASHRPMLRIAGAEQPGMTLSYEPFSATSCRLRRSPRAFPDLRSSCRCRACPHRSGSRRTARSRPGADGVRRPIPAPGKTGRSCRSQRIRRSQRVRLVLVAQLLLGRVPEFILAAFGPAGLLPQAVRAFSDLLFGRFGQFSSPLVKHGPPGGHGGLEGGPCRPAIGGNSGPRIQASIMSGSSKARTRSGGSPKPRNSAEESTSAQVVISWLLCLPPVRSSFFETQILPWRAARKPPSTGSTTPVMKSASSEARKATGPAISAGSPIRSNGVPSAMSRT